MDFRLAGGGLTQPVPLGHFEPNLKIHRYMSKEKPPCQLS